MAKYSTKAQAVKAGRRIGLKGAHKMNSKWMPGSSHAAYLKAKRKKSY